MLLFKEITLIAELKNTMLPKKIAAETPCRVGGLDEIVTRVDELLNLVHLREDLLLSAADLSPRFPLRVPKSFISRMRKGDPADPLLRQVLPSALELKHRPGYSRDPLEEACSAPTKGLLHKYHGRVLLIVVGACAIHCRYCFRRHFPYCEHALGSTEWGRALAYIASDLTIQEVILSGGDPLYVEDRKLQQIIEGLDTIPHLQRLRIHSRMPIILPERVNESLLSLFTSTRLKPILVVHVNHANEIDHNVRAALARLARAGVTLLNQSVLLQGINDSVQALCALSEALFEAGVLPYYLHFLDKVEGAAHFDVSRTRAKQLIWDTLQQLPAYLVPRLVREKPGAKSKIPICSSYF